MPHAFIRYRLPEEQAEYNAAMQGVAAKSTIWDVDQYCRGLLKHGTISDETARHFERIREMLRARPELLND
jgi:hypothetical protein